MSETDEAIEKLKAMLDKLTPEQRVELIERVRGTWCLHCGYAQPSRGSCQCTNDE